MIGRLVLSSRNLYKIPNTNNKLVIGKKCHILSENSDDILVQTNRGFSTKDVYVKLNGFGLNQIEQILGEVGNPDDDLNIYHHIYTKNWLSNKKYLDLWKKYNFNPDFDLVLNHKNSIRNEYNEQVITIDPVGSIDLDDGFTFRFDEQNYYLDIHIADPVSYFDLTKESMREIFMEFINRINTCYIPNTSGSNKPVHLLPEFVVNYVSLLEINESSSYNFRRAISFCFQINKISKEIKFDLIFTKLTNIKNKTYEDFDLEINLSKNQLLKKSLVELSNVLIESMGMDLKYDLVKLEEDISHKMIEIFMIWTNYYSGIYLQSNSKMMIARKQEEKDLPEKLNDNLNLIPDNCKQFLNYSATYTIVVTENNSAPAPVTHYCLGINNYCHVSSPMRRLIDMLNHLLIYDYSLDIIQTVNIEKINNEIKIQKKLSNSYDLISYLKSNNKFKAFVMDLNPLENKTNALLVITDSNLKKMINIELPSNIEKVKLYDLIDIEVYYNSNNFKSNKIPFSIKII